MAYLSYIAAVAILAVVCVHGYDVFTASTAVGTAMDVQARSPTELYVPSRSNAVYKVVRIGGGNNVGSFTTTTLLSISSPTSAYLDTNGNLYLSEQSSHTIKKVVLSSVTVSTLATGFSNPYSCAWNPTNNLLYVNDLSNNRVYTVHAVTGTKTLYAGTGGSGAVDGPRLSAQIACPLYGDLDCNGNFYLAAYCQYTVRKIDASTGLVSTVAGVANSAGFNDGPATSSARLNALRGISVAPDGSVYIGDNGNNRIRRLSGGYLTTVAGNGGGSAIDGPALSAEIGNVWGLTARIPGFAYSSDYNNGRVRGLTNGATGTYGCSTYCCQEVYDECAAIHASCSLLNLTPLQQACQADSALCGVYNLAVAVKNSCNRLGSDCDALISGC